MPRDVTYVTFIALFLLTFSALPMEAVKETSGHPLITETKSGRIFGRRESVPHGRDIEMFLGIPYAEPPVDDLRFSHPRLVKSWTGTRDATDFGPQCMAGEIVGLDEVQPGIQSEDCLYLNVYVPADVDKSLHHLPVMVWIHGGGLYAGSGSIYDGSVLASFNDVIVVTINYRLGLLGFLNIPGTDLTGNYGLLDQVMALKWVQENIGSFGGNSERVTVFGESAGGVSVDLLLLSPLAKGLFNSAIIESGFATSVYASSASKDPNKYAHFVKELQCDITKELLTCLRSKTRKEIIRAQGKVDFLLLGSYFPVPVIDGHFLPDKPAVLLSEGRFNRLESVVLGVTRDEGDSKLYAIQPNPDIPPTRELFEFMFDKVYFAADGVSDLVKQVIHYEYTNHMEPDSPENLIRSWKNLIGDSWYFSRAVYSANVYAKAGIKTYLYQFSHLSAYSIHPKNTGVHHFDEVQYIFGVPWKPTNSYVAQATSYTDVERGLSTMMMRLWSNVAIYGSPNGYDVDLMKWPEYNMSSQEYLDIKLEPTIGRKLRANQAVFWNELVPKLIKNSCKTNGHEKESTNGRKEEL